MPVGVPFNQQFYAGDVIYGVSQARAPYINSLPPHLVHSLRAYGHYVICDEYNNRTFNYPPNQNFVPGYETMDNPVNKHNINNNLDLNMTLLNDRQQSSVTAYYEALAGTRYAPRKAVKMNLEKAQRKGNAELGDLVFRRACKFGLEYVIRCKVNTIHFALDVPPHWNFPNDKIDYESIVTKEKFDGRVPITTSELRCCYRNRHAWIPTGRLKFYHNLIEVEPPWEEAPEVWAVYEAHRIRKGRI